MPTDLIGSTNIAERVDLTVRARRVVTPDGERPAALHIRDGSIVAISDFDDVPLDREIYDAGPWILMPGLVDTHVHINEPGRTEWEGFVTATKAAAAGGVTTLIEMPLNSVPATTTLSGYREKIDAATGKLWVDCGFWGGVVPGNSRELRPLWEAGVFGFKCFLVPSGVDEFEYVTAADLRSALPELASLSAPLLAHAELPSPIEAALKQLAMRGVAASSSDRVKHTTWLASRPREAENKAIELLVSLSCEFNTRIHIVHLASSDALLNLRRAKSEQLLVSVETCPHYLTFDAEDVTDRATQFKCAPPIRERENREKLWAALSDGSIDLIASDHSPCPPDMKSLESGDFLRAWGGVASLQLALPAVWTEARSRGYALTHVARWMCGAPAKLAGLEKQKGEIAVGRDADLVIFDPDSTFCVDPEQLHHRHKLTPYAGRELVGVVQATFVRGQRVFERQKLAAAPMGQVLRRGKM